MRKTNTEEKIANWTSRVVGGSYIVFILIILSLMAIPKVMSGEIMDDPFLMKALIISILYMISVILVATSPAKPITRRAISWVVSIFFHAGLLIYLGVFHEWGSVIFIIGMVETIILLLSCIGLMLLIYNRSKR